MTGIPDELVEKAAHIIDPHAPVGHNMRSWWARDIARATLEAIGLPALLERVEAAEREIERLRKEARECESCAPSQEATWARLVTSIERERDEALAKVTRVEALADGWLRVSEVFDGVRAELLGDAAGDLGRALAPEADKVAADRDALAAKVADLAVSLPNLLGDDAELAASVRDHLRAALTEGTDGA